MSLDSLKKEAVSSNSSAEKLKEIAAINDELARLVATNPRADNKLLEELVLQARKTKNLEIQRAIALNPNTPTRWLIGLAYLFPEEFFDNSAYDLLIIENVNFTYIFEKKLLLKLVLASNAPTSFLSFAADICQTNLKNSQKEDFYPHLTLENQYETNIERIQKDRNYRLGIVSHYSFERFWKWREILIAIASHKNTSRQQLLELSQSDEDVVAEIAKIRLKHHINLKSQKNNHDLNFWNEVALHKQPNLLCFFPKQLLYKLVQLPDISTNFLVAASQLQATQNILHIIANHPKTPKEVLDNLSNNSDPLIGEAAKLHINYVGELTRGWQELSESKINHSQSFYSKFNQVVELKLWRAGVISQSSLPYLHQNSPEEYISTLLYIVCSPSTPKHILDYLENHPRVSQLIKECISYLKQKEDLIFQRLPKSLPINIAEVANHAGHQINPLVANLDTLFEKVQDLTWRKQKRWIVIKNPSLPICLVNLIEKMGSRRCSIYYLSNMLRDLNRGRYIENSEVLYKFSNLEYYGVVLATHPETLGEILSELRSHPVKKVRILVAQHQNITQSSLKNLIDDRDLEVRQAALANPKIDSNLKQELISLKNPNLSLAELQQLANSNYSIVREKVAQHPNVDSSILIKLCNDKLKVRLAVAKHPKTPTDILNKFIAHPEQRLRFAVAQNPGAPVELLIKLSTQLSEETRGVGYHFNPLNLFAFKTLLNYYPDEAIPILDRCLKYPDRPSFARFLVLMNPNISNKFLARYYRSWFWIERYALSLNPNTDREIREKLTQDCNCLVRAAAQSYFN